MKGFVKGKLASNIRLEFKGLTQKNIHLDLMVTMLYYNDFVQSYFFKVSKYKHSSSIKAFIEQREYEENVVYLLVQWQKVNMEMVLSEFIKSIWIKFMIFKYIIKL